MGSGAIDGRLVPPRGGACDRGNAGLALLALSFLAYAIVAGLALGTLTALAAGLTVVTAVELAAIVSLGLGAWAQVREIYR